MITAAEALATAIDVYASRDVSFNLSPSAGALQRLTIASGTYEQVVDVGQCADVATLRTLLELLVQAFDREAPSA